MDKAGIIKIYSKTVWIESDIFGARHVMIQHDDGVSDAFCYASFFYDHRYTSNSTTMQCAKKLAISLGAKEPIEIIHREAAF